MSNDTDMLLGGPANLCVEDRSPPTNHLLWIGRTDSVYFGPAFEACQDCFDAMTVRSTLLNAVTRRCFEPTVIAFARDDSRAIHSEQFDQLIRRFPNATYLEFRSPMCEGFYRFADKRFSGGMFRWSLATKVLIDASQTRASAAKDFVANGIRGLTLVVASRFDVAQSVLCNLPEEQPAAYCRSFEEAISAIYTAVETVFWDESVLCLAEGTNFNLRRFSDRTKHFWIATEPSPRLLAMAKSLGIKTVIQKPGRWPGHVDVPVAAPAFTATKNLRAA